MGKGCKLRCQLGRRCGVRRVFALFEELHSVVDSTSIRFPQSQAFEMTVSFEQERGEEKDSDQHHVAIQVRASLSVVTVLNGSICTYKHTL